jgi:hypothetical protein
MPPAENLVMRDGLRLFSPAASLVKRCSEQKFDLVVAPLAAGSLFGLTTYPYNVILG